MSFCNLGVPAKRDAPKSWTRQTGRIISNSFFRRWIAMDPTQKKDIVVRACSSMYFMKVAVDYFLVTEKFLCNGLLQWCV